MKSRLALRQEGIFLDQSHAAYNDVLAAAAKALAQESGLTEAAILHALMERESFGCTAVGNGCALPHGRIKGLKRACAVFIQNRGGVACDAPDGVAVRFFLAFIVPPQEVQQHLEILSDSALHFSQPEMLDLFVSGDVVAIHRFLTTPVDG